MFDNSDYPEISPYYCNVNEKIIGKFKDEACGIPITEFIGLKSKMYSYVTIIIYFTHYAFTYTIIKFVVIVKYME